MRAALINKTGGTDVLELQEISIPAINQPTDVLVKLKAAGVNPVDAKFRRGMYPINHFPAILGCDGAGVVEKTGKGVSRFKPGDEVFFFHGGIGTGPGNYAEYIVLDECFIAKKPKSIDFIHAAALPLIFITAWETLHDRAHIQSGQTVLIHAGAGGVGHIAIQIAKQAGAKVCTTISSNEKAEFVKKLGADYVINYKQQNFVDAIMQWTDGKGVDIAMDNVGGEIIQATFPAVRYYGDMITLLQPGADIDWTIARQRNLRFSFEIMLSPLLFNLKDAQRHQTWILEESAKLLEKGQLNIHISHVLPLDKVVEAHKLIETGSITGKIVLTID
ncbi:MAG: zinc-dependent alcohol dehydrogenase family protein [Gammaproteobacteria bacterium]|nr:zinc-dependent alcohol dehydrogenase family protein [Gammaproteobacteria bacterium]